jgi:hypothetical protein
MSELDKQKIKIRFISFNLFILSFSIYLLTAAGINYYHSDASVMRFEVTKSIVENADLAIPEGFMGVDKRNYSVHGIGSVLLALPFYILGKLIGVPEIAVSIMNQCFSACSCVLLFLFSIALGYSRRSSLLLALCYGLCTMAWPMAKHPFDHPIENFFILLSVYCMYLYVNKRKISDLLLSAFSLGIAFLTRPTSILVIPPLLIMMVIYSLKMFDRRVVIKKVLWDSVKFFLVFLPFIGVSLWYNHYRFGSIFETGYQLIAGRTGVDFFTGTPLLKGLSGFLISPGKGFFYYSPIALLFFFSIRAFMKRHRGLGISFIFIIVSYLLFLSKNIYWHGDWAWGPRYIFVLTPFFIIPIVEILETDIWKKKKLLKLVVYCIFVVSFIIQSAAVSVDFQKYFVELIYTDKIHFSEASGDGVLPIVEPPTQNYFNWNKSPILAQYKFIYQLAKGINDYRYSAPPDDTVTIEKIKKSLSMNIFDFWWLYEYYVYRSYTGFMVAFMLLIIVVFISVRIWKKSSGS